jgi:hypothetical protein
LPLLFAWEPNDQSITIPQFAANTIKYFFKHFFGLLGRRLVIVGGNLQGRSDLPVLGERYYIDANPFSLSSVQSMVA